jgi:hypothetical protein
VQALSRPPWPVQRNHRAQAWATTGRAGRDLAAEAATSLASSIGRRKDVGRDRGRPCPGRGSVGAEGRGPQPERRGAAGDGRRPARTAAKRTRKRRQFLEVDAASSQNRGRVSTGAGQGLGRGAAQRGYRGPWPAPYRLATVRTCGQAGRRPAPGESQAVHRRRRSAPARWGRGPIPAPGAAGGTPEAPGMRRAGAAGPRKGMSANARTRRRSVLARSASRPRRP